MPAPMAAGLTAVGPRLPVQLHNIDTSIHALTLCRSRAPTKQSLCCRAQANKTAEPLRAPGSESNFTDLPKNREEITLTSDVSDKQMQVRPFLHPGTDALPCIHACIHACMRASSMASALYPAYNPSLLQEHMDLARSDFPLVFKVRAAQWPPCCMSHAPA